MLIREEHQLGGAAADWRKYPTTKSLLCSSPCHALSRPRSGVGAKRPRLSSARRHEVGTDCGLLRGHRTRRALLVKWAIRWVYQQCRPPVMLNGAHGLLLFATFGAFSSCNHLIDAAAWHSAVVFTTTLQHKRCCHERVVDGHYSLGREPSVDVVCSPHSEASAGTLQHVPPETSVLLALFILIFRTPLEIQRRVGDCERSANVYAVLRSYHNR